MKHTARITTLLLVLFVLAQMIGSFLIINDANVLTDGTVESKSNLERPQFEGLGSLIFIFVSVFIGTFLILKLAKFKFGKNVWFVWYGLAVFVAMRFAFDAVLPSFIALILALGLTFLKLHKRHPLIHNITEVFVYAGIGLIFYDLFVCKSCVVGPLSFGEMKWVFLLLLGISIYDAYAVWKSKHMITLAKFTSKTNLFSGLSIQYDSNTDLPVGFDEQKKGSRKKRTHSTTHKQSNYSKSDLRQAILGGGDIIFPLIFTGVIIDSLLRAGFEKAFVFAASVVVTMSVMASLALLFHYGKKEHFYPAMPFVSAGCLVGYLLLKGLLLII